MACAAAFGLGVAAAGDSDRAVPPVPELRVCADPNNLPFSDRITEGFENEIAELIARDLGMSLSYVWLAEQNGLDRTMLESGQCDVLTGAPAGDARLLTTRPYYQSTYVFVQRADLIPAVRSLSDPRLDQLRIGIHVIGDDYGSFPPGVALASRGLARQVAGFSLYGDAARPSPQLLTEAVTRGKIDLAIAWGPMAGYFAMVSAIPLVITPVPENEGTVAARFTYEIAMGVRRNDTALRYAIDGALTRRRTEIAAILARYGVPVIAPDREFASRRGW